MKRNFMIRFLSSVLVIFLLLTGCETEELEVSYIYIPAFDVEANAQSGDISTQITDVRVVLGAESLGFYPLPARIPILASGENLVRLEPVVRIAGLAANRIVYPFYEVFEETLTLVPGSIDTIRPTISYTSTSGFGFVEDFETSNPTLIFDLDDFSDTKFETTATNPSSGSGAGVATLTTTSRIVESATPVLNPTGQNWNRIWLELDYRGDVPLTVAILPETPGSENTRLNRYTQGVSDRDEWRKIYFELVTNGQEEFASQPFRVGFLAVLDTTVTSNLYLDNIKVVHQN